MVNDVAMVRNVVIVIGSFSNNPFMKDHLSRKKQMTAGNAKMQKVNLVHRPNAPMTPISKGFRRDGFNESRPKLRN